MLEAKWLVAGSRLATSCNGRMGCLGVAASSWLLVSFSIVACSGGGGDHYTEGIDRRSTLALLVCSVLAREQMQPDLDAT